MIPLQIITRKIEIEEIDDKATGLTFRIHREAKGISLREVARRAGYSAAYVSDLELGRRGWSQENFQKLTATLSA